MTEHYSNVSLNRFLDVSREKWREVPAGSELLGRVYSSDLLKLSDAELRAAWRALDSGGSNDHRVWYRILYRDFVAGKRILELGSGLGFDALYFARLGARWTCVDIVKDNLTFIDRLAAAEGLADAIDTLWVDDVPALERLTGEFDAIWANGSLHHAPFEIARAESLIALSKLKPGGRWIELYYPYDRWLREGSTAFSEWGKKTDGERTPWAEWHDIEKIKRRLFPARTTTVLDFVFGGGSYGWADLRIDQPVSPELTASQTEQAMRSVDVLRGPIRQMNGRTNFRTTRRGIEFTTPLKMWDYAGAVDISAGAASLGQTTIPDLRYSIDLVLHVNVGSVGVVLTGQDPNNFQSREMFVDAQPTSRRVTITSFDSTPPTYILLRNTADSKRSTGVVVDAQLRFGT